MEFYGGGSPAPLPRFRGWQRRGRGQISSTLEALGRRDRSMPIIAVTNANSATTSPVIGDWSPAVREQVEIDAGYAGYLDRQTADAEALRREEALTLPANLDYAAIGGLSHEVREKLSLVLPRTLGQAGRIEGVTPGALTALLSHVKKAAVAA